MSNGRLQSLKDAFLNDGYGYESHVVYQGRLGVMAKHLCATINGDPNSRKKAYYVEGSHREMGYLLGLMAEPDISLMTTIFIPRMIWELIVWHPRATADPRTPAERRVVEMIKAGVGDLMGELNTTFSAAVAPSVPSGFMEEMRGIAAGCRAANSNTLVTVAGLQILNFGIDWFLANIYSGLTRFSGLARAVMDEVADILPPASCNGFALFGDAANGGHYFGRDFMFPTAGIFEKTACMIVYNPVADGGGPAIPLVSVTAPGMVGSITAMNLNGVAIGVDIFPSAAADPAHVGFNNLPLNRWAVETGATAEAAKDVIVDMERGVPWIYIIADGTTDRACVVEAVYSRDDIVFTDFPRRKLVRGCLFSRPVLPGPDFLRDHKTAELKRGVMVRWSDYAYDDAYLEFDPRLFERAHKNLPPGWREPGGFINRTYEERNCPGFIYFAPQRETNPEVVLTTNHAVIPEMRYTAMTKWLRTVFGRLNDDSQWRYDALNGMILEALDQARQTGRTGVISEEARKILDFLNPIDGRYPDYYGVGKKVIEGGQSLMDLKALTIESHYGYYADKWVKLSLKEYIL